MIVEAERWFKLGDVKEAPILGWDKSDKRLCFYCGKSFAKHGRCETLEVYYVVCPGDYIIKDVEGEFCPCKPDIFEEIYEKL